MASGSPRARIDQFFNSKKKRAISPRVKPGRSIKEGGSSKEASPSAKCSLDSYLVKSQNDNKSCKEGTVKRNLTLQIGLPAENETKGPITSIESETGNLVQNGSDIVEVGIAVAGGDEKTTAISAHDRESSELNQFATEFLSLYFGHGKLGLHLESKSNDLKRRGSPSTIAAEGKTSKKRHSVAFVEALQSENNPLETVAGKAETVILPHEEVEAGFSDGQGQISLKKCTTTTSSVLPAVESSTPCSVYTMNHVRGTPRSFRGSCMISPGEEFWDEAIQVADGLLVPKAKICEVGGNEKETLNALNHKSVGQVRPENFVRRFEAVPGEEGSCIQGRAISGFSGFPNKKGKDQGVQSPLPIKHFDFTLEDRNLDENSKQFHLRGDTEGSEKKVHSNPEYCFVDQKAPITLDGQVKQAIKGGADISAETSFDHGGLQLQGNSILQESESIYSDLPDTGNRNLVTASLPDGSCTPSSSVPVKDNLDLSNWVPAEVCHIYRQKGLSRLYQWQVDCLQVEGVMQKRNLVYCASTSAGKSFVAEILMLRMVIKTGKMAILVLPYVSICTEKAEHLELLLEPLGKRVRSYYGNQGGGTLPTETSVAVCTIEKANSLLNRLLEEGRLSEVGIIVIDELHMVADPHRGYLLELMLTKLRYAAGEGSCQSSSGESSGTSSSSRSDAARGLQMVGMSATMPNVASVAEWLNAALYQTEFRPVPLEEFVKVGNNIYNKSMEIVRTIPKSADLGGKDPDHVVEMCNEVVQEGNSVLLFCSSRKGCESTAKHVAKYLTKFSAKVQDERCEFADCSAAIDALRKCPVGLDPVLEETLPSGVAYHHAGLTVEEREIVETCYRKGLIRVLTATSTLAAGVNLPARRVIFRQPRIGRDFIDVTRYRQMAGRAGRTGIDAKGESVLICKPEELKRICSLLNGSCPALQSCLSEDKNGMTHAILEVVASGIVQTASDIHRYVRCTLLNCIKPFQEVVKSAQDSLRWLCHRKFLEWNEDTKLYSATPLGRASFGSSLSPEESLIVLDDLSRAREGFVLASDLHIVYLVTPVNVEVEPDWELLYEKFVQLSNVDQSVGNRIGVLEPFLMRMAHGVPLRFAARSRDDTKGLHGYVDAQLRSSNISTLSDEQSLRVCRRFYVALILSCLVQELPVGEVCEAFKVARGFVQSLQDNAGRFASMVCVFCERLGWHDLEGLVSRFQNRVSFGVRAEIAELTMIPYVKGSRARALYRAGLRTPQAIGEASVGDIAKALFESSSWVAQENLAQQRLQFGVAKKIKNGARKIILDKAEEARVAAFSAFKSLGFNIPQFSLPPLSHALDHQAELNNSASSGGEAGRSTRIQHHDNQIARVTSIDANDNDSKVPPQTSVSNMKAMDREVNGQNSIGCSKLKMEMNSASLVANGSLNNMNDGGHGLVSNQQTVEDCTNNCIDKGPISVSSLAGGLDYFLNLWDSVSEFFFDVHFRKKVESTSDIAFEVHGMAICWNASPVYYVNFDKDLFNSGKISSKDMSATPGSSVLVKSLEVRTQWWTRIGKIMGKRNVRKYAWNLKFQIQSLKYAFVPTSRSRSESQILKNSDFGFTEGLHHKMPPIIVENVIDVGLVAWILWPDEERSSSPNLEKEVKKRLTSEAAAAATRSGRWKNQMRRAAHNGCCRRVALTRALYSVLWKLLGSEELEEALIIIEAPLVHVLADMEAWGIGVDMEGCLKARHLLSKKLKVLEKEAYKLAGTTFSLNSPADIANVLFERLKLPVPEGRLTGKLHASTDKHCLDLLRNEHPIISVIKEHRTLAKLFHSTLGSICKLSKLCTRTQKHMLHGHWLQTSTATGRLSMEEPNLQCVEHVVNFDMPRDNFLENGSNVEQYKVNARDFFIPTEDHWLLLTADYSQIELRLMAHFSEDSYLIELLSKRQGDVFTMMASRWSGKAEADITSQEREQIKRLVYGILYGMGANSLAEQIGCSPEEAKLKIKSFKSSFLGVGSWLQEAVSFCRQKGYVQTLKGRKRFLSKIKLGNDLEKSKAQRQAVNSICQGSAADIIKIAMLNIYFVIVGGGDPNSNNELAKRFDMLKNRCRILLQVHDELVMEAEPSVIREAALLLKTCMESAASLRVPLQVKLKIGKSWGSLEPYDTDS